MNITKINISKNEYRPMSEMPINTLLISSCGYIAIRDEIEVVFLDKKIAFTPVSVCSDTYKIFDGELILKN